MSILFLEYPKCSTCQRAKKWLVENGIEFTDRHIVEEKSDNSTKRAVCLLRDFSTQAE